MKDCDELVCFWDGESKGAMHSTKLAIKAGKPVQVWMCKVKDKIDQIGILYAEDL